MGLTFEPRLYGELDADDRPSLLEALVPVFGTLAFLGVGIVVYGLNPQSPLFWGISFTGLSSWYWLSISWAELCDGITDSLHMGIRVILIVFVVYALIATWVAAGMIPSLMHYGLDLLTPTIFPPITAVLASIVTFAIGLSWMAAGTLGVSFIGVNAGLGIPAPITAGAILSGAYMGDKQSPLSDTTNLATAVTNTDLFDHVNTMRDSSLVAFGIAVVPYAVLGVQASGNIPVGCTAEIQGALTGSYAISVLTFAPLVVTLGLALYDVPALPTLGAGVFADILASVVMRGTAFGAVWSIAQSGTSSSTGMELVDDLLTSGGMIGGVWVVTIAIAVLSLGGMLERAGILAVLAHHFGRLSRGVASLTGVTAVSAVSMNVLATEQYISIVVPGIMLRNLYGGQGLQSENLSWAIESAGTTTSALIPWNSGALFMAGMLGIGTLEYVLYYFFGLLSPLVLFLMDVTGWQITHQPGEAPGGAGDRRGSPSSTGG